MWVWPQVPVGGTSASTPLRPKTKTPLPEYHRWPGGQWEEGGGGQEGRGLWLQGRFLQYNDRDGGGSVQSALSARPTSR